MAGVGLAIVILVVLYLAIALLYEILLVVGFNATFYVENTIRLHSSINPIVAWALTGAFLGACAGLWYSSNRYRFRRVKPFIITGIILLFMGLVLLNKPQNFSASHPFDSEVAATKARMEEERRQWEAEHARYVTVSGGANVRSGPSIQNARSATLQTGSIVYEVKRQGDWTQIEYRRDNGRTETGWVRSDLLSVRAPQTVRHH